MFKRLLLSSTVILAVDSFAAAADLTPTPPPTPFTWAGLYLGGQVGFAWENDYTTTFNTGPVGVTPVVTGVFPSTANADGVVGGAHLGYNWKVNQFVLGLEGEIDGVDLTQTISPVYYVSLNTNLYLQGALLGRIGYAFERVLVYATGGGVEGLLKNSYTVLGTLSTLPEAHSGWTVGGGVEYAVDDHWSARIEYRHSDFGTINETQIVDFVQASHHVEENQVKLGFSYRIPPAPSAPAGTGAAQAAAPAVVPKN
ncbi:MAG TPA: outer membrane protein [Methylocella sp.]|nr:outer membrane protein [Methylocella sp.]